MDDHPKLGIVAGGGVAPFQLVRACQDIGRPYHLICLQGHADSALGQGHSHTWLSLGDLAKLRDLCAAQEIKELVMIGHVRRPSVAELKPDWLTLKVLAKIGLGSLGDDGVLRAVGKVLEEECRVKVIGAAEVFADMLTPEGPLTKTVPNDQALADIQRGAEVAQTLGQMDVGQAVIVQQGIVLGVESIGGTDSLIAHSAEVRREGQGGVLVKTAKPQQDNRFDLPAIGVETVHNAHNAGLIGIAVQAGRSLILEREKTLEAADMAGLFIVGISLPQEEEGNVRSPACE